MCSRQVCFICREWGPSNERVTRRGIVMCYPCWADVEEMRLNPAYERTRPSGGGKPEPAVARPGEGPGTVVPPPDPLQLGLKLL